jgi:hypothetical protein
MIWRTTFVVVLFASLLVACQDRVRELCPDQVAVSTTYRTKNKALGVSPGGTIAAQNATAERRGKC